MTSDEATLRNLFSAGCKLLAVYFLIQTLISLAPSLRILNRTDSGNYIDFLAVTVPGVLWPIGLVVAANPLSRWLVPDRDIPSVPTPSDWFQQLLTLVIIGVSLISLITVVPEFLGDVYHQLATDRSYLERGHLLTSLLEIVLGLGFILTARSLSRGIAAVLEWLESLLRGSDERTPHTETLVAVLFWISLIVVFFVSYVMLEV